MSLLWLAVLAVSQAASQPASAAAPPGPPTPLVDVPVIGGSARFSGEVYSRLSLDTKFEPTGEDVFEFRNRAQLKVDYRRGDLLRVFIGARADGYVLGGAPPDQTFLFYNASHVRADAFVELREAFVDFYTRYVDIRLGNQIFTWGQN